MKVLMLALVLGNVLFFMWSTWVAEPTVDVPLTQPDGAAELTLLHELDDAPLVAAVDDLPADREPADADEGAALLPMLDVPADLPPSETEADAVAQTPEPAPPDAPVAEPEAPATETVLAAAPVEPESTDAPAAPDAAQPVPLAVLGTGCASLGPFAALSEASAAAERLRADGFAPRERLAEEQVWVGHWVYLPSYATRAEAVVVVERLREEGVKDIYIEPRGDRENAVSLGLFSDRENAELYAGRVRQFDVRPQITDRFRVDSAYWVDISLADGRALDAAAFAGDEQGSVRLDERACEDASDS